jgi:hypothetical protein
LRIFSRIIVVFVPHMKKCSFLCGKARSSSRRGERSICRTGLSFWVTCQLVFCARTTLVEKEQTIIKHHFGIGGCKGAIPIAVLVFDEGLGLAWKMNSDVFLSTKSFRDYLSTKPSTTSSTIVLDRSWQKHRTRQGKDNDEPQCLSRAIEVIQCRFLGFGIQMPRAVQRQETQNINQHTARRGVAMRGAGAGYGG